MAILVKNEVVQRENARGSRLAFLREGDKGRLGGAVELELLDAELGGMKLVLADFEEAVAFLELGNHVRQRDFATFEGVDKGLEPGEGFLVGRGVRRTGGFFGHGLKKYPRTGRSEGRRR
jgi:hypothetical protein